MAYQDDFGNVWKGLPNLIVLKRVISIVTMLKSLMESFHWVLSIDIDQGFKAKVKLWAKHSYLILLNAYGRIASTILLFAYLTYWIPALILLFMFGLNIILVKFVIRYVHNAIAKIEMYTGFFS